MAIHISPSHFAKREYVGVNVLLYHYISESLWQNNTLLTNICQSNVNWGLTLCRFSQALSAILLRDNLSSQLDAQSRLKRYSVHRRLLSLISPMEIAQNNILDFRKMRQMCHGDFAVWHLRLFHLLIIADFKRNHFHFAVTVVYHSIILNQTHCEFMQKLIIQIR